MKLSVIMITYNHERFIAQAIQSVLDQRVNFDYEIVVGEDCSTDRTRDIVMDFHRKHPNRITPILREKNVGMMRNFIDLLAACRGRYLAMLEGDDYWTCHDKLQRQVDFLDANADYAISCGRAEVLNEIEEDLGKVLPTRAAGPYRIDELLRDNFIMTCTVMFRWGSLKQLPSWLSEMKLGDWPLYALVAQSGKIFLMDDVLAAYRVHSGGVWSSRSQVSRLKETVRMLTALDEELGFRYTSTIRETIVRFYLRQGASAHRDGDRIETARCLVNSLRYGGGRIRDIRPTLKGLAWYTLLGSWHPVLAKAKKAILG